MSVIIIKKIGLLCVAARSSSFLFCKHAFLISLDRYREIYYIYIISEMRGEKERDTQQREICVSVCVCVYACPPDLPYYIILHFTIHDNWYEHACSVIQLGRWSITVVSTLQSEAWWLYTHCNQQKPYTPGTIINRSGVFWVLQTVLFDVCTCYPSCSDH